MMRTVLLGDIAQITMGQSPKSEYYNKSGEGLPFMQGVRTFGSMYPTVDTWCTKPTKTADKGDILFSVRAPVGDINYAPTQMCIGRGLASLKSRNNIFLYYVLEANKSRLINSQTGSVFGAVNASIMNNFKLTIPDTAGEQDNIADILGSIDEKIELNRKMNETLEKMGQALFKKYFITNPEAKDWENISITDNRILRIIKPGITPFKGNKKYAATANVSGTNITGALEEITYNERPSRANMQPLPGSIWFARMLGEHKALLVNKDDNEIIENVVLSTGFLGLMPVDVTRIFVWCYINSEVFSNHKQSLATGAVMVSLNNGAFSKITIKLPDYKLLEKFNEEASKLYDLVASNNREITTLTELRDSLLPRLVFGKIKLN